MDRRQQYTRGPVAIDPASGFKVPYRNLVRQYDGEWVDRRFVDKRNPQDFLRARPDNPKLDHPRPEATDVFLAVNITMEDGITSIVAENGQAILTEGQLNGSGL